MAREARREFRWQRRADISAGLRTVGQSRSPVRSACARGPELRTLADARSYILTLSEGEAKEARWQSAARKLLEACESGDVAAVTRQIEFALFMGANLVLR